MDIKGHDFKVMKPASGFDDEDVVVTFKPSRYSVNQDNELRLAPDAANSLAKALFSFYTKKAVDKVIMGLIVLLVLTMCSPMVPWNAP